MIRESLAEQRLADAGVGEGGQVLLESKAEWLRFHDHLYPFLRIGLQAEAGIGIRQEKACCFEAVQPVFFIVQLKALADQIL